MFLEVSDQEVEQHRRRCTGTGQLNSGGRSRCDEFSCP